MRYASRRQTTEGRRQKTILVSIALLILLSVICCPSSAMEATEQLPNTAQEAHARDLFKHIRCVVCQAESIDESQALLAADIRLFVRQSVAAGTADAAILAALQDKYGDAVLMQPPLRADTILLWAAPLLLVVMGGVVWWRQGRKA